MYLVHTPSTGCIIQDIEHGRDLEELEGTTYTPKTPRILGFPPSKNYEFLVISIKIKFFFSKGLQRNLYRLYIQMCTNFAILHIFECYLNVFLIGLVTCSQPQNQISKKASHFQDEGLGGEGTRQLVKEFVNGKSRINFHKSVKK